MDELAIGSEEMAILSDVCGDDNLRDYELTRELLDLERRYLSKVQRRGLYEDLEKAFKKHLYSDEGEALESALKKDSDHKEIDGFSAGLEQPQLELDGAEQCESDSLPS